MNVPRSRFLPVKNCSDLFVVQSDLYALNNEGVLSLNPKRIFPQAPLVKLGDHFKKVNNYSSRFASAPHIIDLEHLTVSGDVWFGSDVTLRVRILCHFMYFFSLVQARYFFLSENVDIIFVVDQFSLITQGTVIVVANPPSRIDIPSGAVLEDKVVSGELRILDH